MNYIEFEEIEIINQTDKAVLVQFVIEEEELWVPWSVIEDNDEGFTNKYTGKIYIAEWWVQTQGLA